MKEKDLAYDLALTYAQTKLAEFYRRKTNEEIWAQDNAIALESLDDWFTEAYEYFRSIEDFGKHIH